MTTLYERLEAVGAGTVVVLGLVLLFVPEVATSIVGLILVAIGIGIWISQWRKMKAGRPGGVEEGEAVVHAAE